MALSHLRSPEELARCLLENDRRPDPDHTLAAIKHRQRLLRSWGISHGATILEIGCGQGDCTVVLADAVGDGGLVVGIDPAPDDYGIPSLGRAHKHVKASVVGKQIQFIRSDAVSYLTSPTGVTRFDFIVLCHCIWYLSEPSKLAEIFDLARSHARTQTILLAEFGMAASVPAAVPHVLVACAVNALESVLTTETLRNMHCVTTPRQIADAAERGGWIVKEEDLLVPEAEQRDGWREVVMVLEKPHRQVYENDVESLGVSEKIKSMLLAARDAVEESVRRLDGGLAKVRNMDVWVVRFNLAQ